MQTYKRWVIWILILCASAVLRLPHADWDEGYALHPDERYIVDLSREVPLYSNPCQVDPQYPYGHLPLYILRVLFPASAGVDPLYACRLLSGLVGVLIVAITGAIGRVGGDDFTAWIASLIVTFAPLLVQSARFYTVDSLAVAAVCLSLLAALKKRWCIAGMTGAFALACKISMVWVWPVLVLSLVSRHQNMLPIKYAHNLFLKSLIKLVGWGFIIYMVASPWMILDPIRCWTGPITQARLVGGENVVPYTLQFTGTLPLIYPINQMAVWGLGPSVVWVGVVAFITGIIKWRTRDSVARQALMWILLYGTTMGVMRVKFPRYFLPLYPWIAILASKAICGSRSSHSHSVLRCIGAILVMCPTLILGIAQASTYNQPHPWITASRWINGNIKPGTIIAHEAWDHPLPLASLSDPYRLRMLPVYDEESLAKADDLEKSLEIADVFAISSRRGYAALSRNIDDYNDTMTWYKEVMQEREVFIFTRCPQIGPFAFSDDPLRDNGLLVKGTLYERCNTTYVVRLPVLDESYRVYDAPMVILLIRKE